MSRSRRGFAFVQPRKDMRATAKVMIRMHVVTKGKGGCLDCEHLLYNQKPARVPMTAKCLTKYYVSSAI